jgi:hypothetical protein
MTVARLVMVAIGALCLFAGVFLLSRLRRGGLSEPASVAHRIWGTIAIAFGAMLSTFATAMPQAAH